MKPKEHIPALKYDILTDFYDYILGKTMPEQKIKKELIRKANFKPGEKVLDFGSGTATLSILAKKSQTINILGIDVDPKIIEIAKRKIEKEGLNIPILK